MSRRVIRINQQELEQLLTTASATAAVLLEGESVRAAVGALSPSGFQAVAAAMRRHWHDPAHRDLNRTVGFSIGSQFYFLFAKFLSEGENILGLVFPLQTPLIRLRQDMTNFMRAILGKFQTPSEDDEPLERSLQFILKHHPEPDPEEKAIPSSGVWQTEITYAIDQLEEPPVPDEARPQPGDVNRLPPNTDQQTPIHHAPPGDPSGWIAPDPNMPDVNLDGVEAPWQHIDPLGQDEFAPNLSAESEPMAQDSGENAKPLSDSDWQPLQEFSHHEQDLVSIFQDDYEFRDGGVAVDDGHCLPTGTEPGFNRVVQQAQEDTTPNLLKSTENEWEEDVSDVTFYLVPRVDRHYLLGELSHRLRCWLPATCETYGWQLDFLSVRPDYLKWTLRDFPEILIREMLQIVRRQTSVRIFRVFPNLKTENRAGDYWAPGYLVDTQNREFSTQALISHMAKSRLIAAENK